MRITSKWRWFIAALGLFCVFAVVAVLNRERIPGVGAIVQRLRGKATVADRMAQFGPAARRRWQPYFHHKGVIYPPQRLLLVGLKRERQLQVYAANTSSPFKLVRSLPVLGLSGKAGPKLRYGDYQVPEGFYRIESLNPNSAFHLALRVNYPNAFDRAQAEKDGRSELGGDIMIHGYTSSIGCLAMGNEAIEDLFVLAEDVGREKIEVLLSPIDFRVGDAPADEKRSAWVTKLYSEIEAALKELPVE